MAHNGDSYHEDDHKSPPPTSPTTLTTVHVHHRHQQPWPPPDHRSRASEFYGFVAWTSTYLLFVIYLLWAFLPDEYIIWLGVTWYPSREWAILVPSWSIVTVLFTYFMYFALAIAGTPPLDDINSITDGHAMFPTPQDGGRNPYLASTEPNSVPELYDIPISMVNRVLYRRDQHLEKANST